MVHITKVVHDNVENIVGKGENAGYQFFFFFFHNVSKAFSFQAVNSCDCVVKGLNGSL